MSMFHGNRVPEVSAVDAESGQEIRGIFLRSLGKQSCLD